MRSISLVTYALAILSCSELVSALVLKRQVFTNTTTTDFPSSMPTTDLAPTTMMPIPLPTAFPAVTIYKATIYVQIIIDITVIIAVYNEPVVTFIGGAYYTFTVPAQTTSSYVDNGSGATTFYIAPAQNVPVPTVTTVLGGQQTITYVPSAGPSIVGSPTTDAGASQGLVYTFGVGNGICTCPIPVTATQYITVSALAGPAPITTTTLSPDTITVPAGPTSTPDSGVPVTTTTIIPPVSNTTFYNTTMIEAGSTIMPRHMVRLEY